MASESPKTPEAAIEQGRQCYTAKRFRPALEQFTRAMKLCPCARGMKRERCKCKDYEKVALEDGSIFNEAMYKCSCDVGKTFNKCHYSSHLQALDYRAATFEAMEELDRARRDAEWMLELAPRLPDGYLRLGKIARLQKNHELAWAIYNAGIEVGNENRLAGPKLQKLYAARRPLQLRFSRRDPLKNPPEIVQRIFSNLDLVTLVRCLRVSKHWSQFLSGRGNERLWRDLIFTDALLQKAAPGLNAIKKLVSYSGRDIRRLAINNVPRFRLTQAKLNNLAQGSRNLHTLSLMGRAEEELTIPEHPDFLCNLTHLTLVDFTAKESDLINPLLNKSAGSLEHVQLVGLSQYKTPTVFPNLVNLKYLCLQENGAYWRASFSVHDLAEAMPNLEQLWLWAICLLPTHLPQIPELPHGDLLHTLWRKLKVVVLSGSSMLNPVIIRAIQEIISLQRGNHLQHLDFDFGLKSSQVGATDNGTRTNIALTPPVYFQEGSERVDNQYSDLRFFRLTGACVDPPNLERVLADAISNGKLHTFNIAFPLESYDMPEGHASCQHLEAYGWLRGAPSIRCIVVSGFRFARYPRDEREMPLPGFLASFPNLEILEIHSTEYEPMAFCALLVAILKATKLRKIYQRSAHGMALDHLKALTEANGVELIWGERPRSWPVKIEE